MIAPMLMTMNLLVGADVFAAVSAAEWDALAEGSMTDTPFQRHAYQQAWWKHLGVGELYTVVVRDGQDKLIGLAPFYVRDGVVQFNASKEESDYLDIITKAEDAEVVWTAVLDCLCSEAFPAWQALDCHCIPSASPTLQILPRLADGRGFILSTAEEEVCPIIPLTGDFEEYLASIDKKQRHEIRRKMRKAEGNGGELEVIGKGDDLPAAVDDFLRLLQLSMQEKADWLTDGRRALFHEVAQAALAADMLQLMFMRVDGRRYSALFNFIYHNRTWVYNSGLDMREHDNLSLGVVLSSNAIQLAAEAGFSEFDFLRGNETYKYRFGAHDTHIYRMEMRKEE